MQAVYARLRNQLWMLLTGTTAAAVFVITFVAVSAASDGSGGATITRVVADPPALTRQLPAEDGDAQAQAAAEQSAQASPAQQDVEAAEPTAAAAPAPQEADTEQAVAPAQEEQAEIQTASEVEEEEAAEEVEAEPVRTVTLPEFEEDELIFGSDGAEGGILAGRGIVRSSGMDRRTAWEILIPSARIKAAIVRVSLTPTRAFGAPDNPFVIGWWEDGPAPGERGNVLLDGHRDFEDLDENVGTGVCWELPNTTVGDFVLVRDNEAGLVHIYIVIEAATVPWNAPEGVNYLQPSDRFILTLITCEGSFDSDSHNYSNRRIIVAELTDSGVPLGAAS